ncbi:MAG: Na+/H+ antiporter subunit D [Phycisphaeraceae bacterium]|nr:Na+/H+ antiporter subunit D [Phycisphaeraceae bacterium]
MSLLVLLPVLIPLCVAALSMVAWRSLVLQRVLGTLGSVALLVSAVALLLHVDREGILALQMGSWPAPFGITFVADRMGAIMTVLAGATGVATFLYSPASVDERRQRLFYYPLLSVLLAGVCGAFLTGDIFNLYVWFEVLLMSSFVLLALGGERPQLEGAIKYVTLNLISSVLFLIAVGILYGAVGTLNMADLALKVAQAEDKGVITAVSVLFMAAFGIKSAAFPLFFWLPSSYHTPPFAVSAIFAGLLTKVGVYALIRVFTTIFTQDTAYTHTILLIGAGLTMVTGVLGAAAQFEFRRVLSFHIVSQIGYMIMGLALYTPLALAGAVFYIMHHIIVKANLFFIAGLAHRIRGTSSLKRAGAVSVYRVSPLTCIIFLVAAMSLAGLPPLSGFFAKLILVRAGLEAESYTIVGVAIVVGLLTLFSMTKIWAEAFWKSPGEAPGESTGGEPAGREHAERTEEPECDSALAGPPTAMMYAVCGGLAVVTVLVGVFAGPVFGLAERTAAELLNNGAYIRAVLGENP